MTDVLGIFMLLLSFKFLFVRNSLIVNSLMQTLIPIEAPAQITIDSTLP